MWGEKIWQWVRGQHVDEAIYLSPDYLKWSIYIKMYLYLYHQHSRLQVPFSEFQQRLAHCRK